MERMRNKEIRRMLFVMALMTLLGSGAAFFFSPAAGWAAGAFFLALSAVFLWFTLRRYRALQALADYLKRVNAGAYSLDLPDHDEGELSILKSEIYKVTVSLREQNERLRDEKRRLADALFDISHQLKTPLTSLSVMTDLLAQNPADDGRRREFTGRLRSELERLIWLTDALLKLSRLDAGVVAFSARRVSFAHLIERAARPLLIPMELKNQAFSVRTDGGGAFCDPNWTAEALLNILKNCMEHTPAGGSIEVSASENALFSEIRVRDSGPGIDKADLPFVFERFYQGRGAVGSAGIGLSMAKAIAVSQGGDLEAKNPPGGGAGFILRFASNRGAP